MKWQPEVAAHDDWHKLRLSTKPGITGLWQVSGRSKVTLDEMVRMDLSYIQHASLVLDLKILLRTPISVLLGNDNGE
jgi:lipopolysaccharide/colanic/teichoic acid biosynthesis glycosyltransferase